MQLLKENQLHLFRLLDGAATATQAALTRGASCISLTELSAVSNETLTSQMFERSPCSRWRSSDQVTIAKQLLYSKHVLQTFVTLNYQPSSLAVEITLSLKDFFTRLVCTVQTALSILRQSTCPHVVVLWWIRTVGHAWAYFVDFNLFIFKCTESQDEKWQRFCPQCSVLDRNMANNNWCWVSGERKAWRRTLRCCRRVQH